MSAWKNLVLVPAVTLAVAVPPASALDQEQIGREPTSSEMFADGLIARPLGLFATVLGAAAFVVTLPFSLPSKSTARAAKVMVAEPAEYTFERPLGQFDSCETLPESCK
jgi:hypothetical protein